MRGITGPLLPFTHKGNSEIQKIFNYNPIKLPDKLQPYGLYVYYVVHICDLGMLRVKSRHKVFAQ